jgi:hypothetical protein
VARRLLLVQIDGLSAGRLAAALGTGRMPHLRRWLDSGAARLRVVTSASAPSTPVFTAGLLYGARAEVPGFAWYDRGLEREVRMDLPEDVQAIERELGEGGTALLADGASYGAIWCGGVREPGFNVAEYRLVSPRRLVSAAALARLAARLALELGVGAWDFQRWCRKVGTTRFEWRFLYMRLLVSVVMRDVATDLAVADVRRGVPRVFLDYLGYDEYAHRRGPDSELALYNLRGIDAAIGRLVAAVAEVPALGYDLYVISDHGQSATTPFEWVTGRDLHGWVLEQVAPSEARHLDAQTIAELVTVRTSSLWLRTLWRPLRPVAQLYAGWLARRLSARLDGRWRRALDGVEIVSGGSVAHLYFGGGRRWTLEEIDRRFPRLLPALVRSPAVGLVVGCAASGAVVFHRGRCVALDDREALSALEPFRRLGVDLLQRLLGEAARGRRHGDLVIYGAFAEAGEIAFDFEFGSHGGVGVEELEQFVVHPASVELPFAAAEPAEAFHRFFAARYPLGAPAAAA